MEERELRANIETELMTKIKQYNDVAIEMEELKDKNLELYEANMRLEEQSAGLRHVNHLNKNKDNTDEEHIKEMLGTQNLLREEMKQKDLYREQYQNTMKQLIELKDRAQQSEKALEGESQRCKLEVQLLEEKNVQLLE